MDIRGIKRSAFRMAIAAAIALAAANSSSSARESPVPGCEPQEKVADTSSDRSRSPLERARRECPALGLIIEKYALQDLGEAVPGESPNLDTPQIALVAAFAASGDAASARHSAEHALSAGAARPEFEEILYLTAVHAGVPKAIEAMRALSDLFIEGTRDRCPDRSARAELRQF